MNALHPSATRLIVRRERRRDLGTALAIAVIVHATLLFAVPQSPRPTVVKTTTAPLPDFTLTPEPPTPPEPAENSDARDAKPSGGVGAVFDPSDFIGTAKGVEIFVDPRQITTVKPDIPPTTLEYRPPNPNPGPGEGGEGGIQIFDTASLDRAPEPVLRPAPVFPAALRKEVDHATVTAQFIVLPDGTVSGIRILHSSHRGFEAAVEQALSRWKFKPGWKKSRKVAARMEQVFHFSLGE